MSLTTLWTLQGYVESVANQDKLTKLVQYGAKLYSYLASEADVESSKRYAKLSSIIADGRRLSRFGTELKFMQILSKFSLSKLGDFTELLTLLNAFCMTVYIIFDHYFWLASAGVIKGDKKVRSALAWFWGVIFNLVLTSLKLHATIQKEQKELEQKKDARATTATKRTLGTQYFKLVPDLIIAINSAELTDKFSNDGLLGVLGIVSGLQALITTWPKK